MVVPSSSTVFDNSSYVPSPGVVTIQIHSHPHSPIHKHTQHGLYAAPRPSFNLGYHQHLLPGTQCWYPSINLWVLNRDMKNRVLWSLISPSFLKVFEPYANISIHIFYKVFMSLLQYCFCCLCSGSFGHEACGILVPWPGIEPVQPMLWKAKSQPQDHQEVHLETSSWNCLHIRVLILHDMESNWGMHTCSVTQLCPTLLWPHGL